MLRSILVAASVALMATTAMAGAPAIAVLAEPGFPSIKSTTVSPESMATALREAGFAPRLATVAEATTWLSDDDDPPDALVSTYGNAFPQSLHEPLRAYLSRDGIVATNGIAFVHVIVPDNPGWKTLGHSDAFPARIGAGGFVSSRDRRVAAAPLARELGLGSLPWEQLRLLEELQGPNSTTMSAGAAWRPLVESPSGAAHAAIVEPTTGGTIVWYGTTDFAGPGDLSGFVLERVATRALALALKEQGTLAPEAASTLLAAPITSPLLSDFQRSFEPRSYPGERGHLYPVADDAPTGLVTLDLRDTALSADERLVAISAQGLVNGRRDQSRQLFLIHGEADVYWLRFVEERRYVEETTAVASVKELLAAFAIERAIVVPAVPPQAIGAAQLMAPDEHAVLVRDRATAERLGLDVAADLADRWQTNDEVLAWCFAEFGDRIDRRAVAIYHPSHIDRLRDYLIANRIFTFWVSGPGEAGLPGVRAADEERLVRRLLVEEFPPNIPVLGYPYAGDGVGLGEIRGVTFLSASAKFLVPSDWLGNLSTLTCMERRAGAFPESAPSPADTAPSANIHASIVVSDGDNLCAWYDWFPKYLGELGPTSAPLALTVGPSIGELLPPVADAIATGMTRGHSVGGAVSGIGYIYPEEYGRDYGEARVATMDEFLALTQQRCTALNLRWLWIMGYGAPGSRVLRDYATGLPGVPTFMGGYGREAETMDESVEWVDDSVVFHSVTGGGKLEDMRNQIDAILTDPKRPLFLHIFTINWELKPAEMRNLLAEIKQRGIAVVAPEDLNRVARRDRRPD